MIRLILAVSTAAALCTACAPAATDAEAAAEPTPSVRTAAAVDAASSSPQAEKADTPNRSDTLVPFELPERAPKAAIDCAFEGLQLPADAKVYAAGAYSGRKLNYQIDQSGHEATRIDVAVHEPNAPVALMLGAYEPTVWNIGWSPTTRIAAVLVSGYHRQEVSGLPADVPLLISTYDNRGPCGYYYVARDQAGRLNPISLRVWGRKVDMVYPAVNGAVTVGQPLADTSSLVTSSRISPDSFRDREAPLAGKAGLQDAIAKGVLREARREDVEAWAVARAQVAVDADVPPVAGQPPSRVPQGVPYNSYVVLKAMHIPAGLYGANAATFYVPKGVPRPSGNPGHSRIYDFNTVTCAGLTCME